ncbi:hypothetical protein [Brevundimonas vesicularis]|uniref:Uncharacterized protein n=1 Tax=Brevundimonas vesicularis TaxID=41276 RepID=A0ABU4KNG6_BREVE|nr:hypothetical protein [Brevundimonas vesicularis]MDX2334570.1 hypothetical protein [Brevundimonas vesicularis]
MSARFRKTELTRAAIAMRDAGVDSYEITFDDDGKPVVKVGPMLAANDPSHDVANEIEAWARENPSDAA